MPNPPASLALIQDDPWLSPYEIDILDRLNRFKQRLKTIKKEANSLKRYAEAYQYFGINFDSEQGAYVYREWAPQAQQLSLIGDFNDWDRRAHPLKALDNGVWEIVLPKGLLKHKDLVKVHVVGAKGPQDRIPAYIRRAVQDPQTHEFRGQVWQPDKPFVWTDEAFTMADLGVPFIYEAHTGMAQEKEGLGTYREFADQVLPRIKALGYNCVQLMAVQEHPYYGSFGYHVSNFFAPSSRFGTPEDLKYLINKAHGMGIAMVMDVVHSHAVKNLAEGLNEFDGSEDQYFHPGGRGNHSSWDSKLFNYGKPAVQQFLLSNLAYWLREFHFDGFRFDGVTSMLYLHHGDFTSFDHYDKYFKEGVEWDAITYLQLGNHLIHEINPHALSIAEDMSGMPGCCRKITEGGLGFDYRLGMGIPDYWIKLLKHKRDEDWDIHDMWHTLSNRRWKEKTVAYAESHDQALVGDKTLAFWLMDKEMYWHMNADDPHPTIARGIALLKMIRLFTAVLGGEAYLNFMGNEFGHPEWVDFPREGNNWSYKYARRQWSLVDNPDLKYHFLRDFDEAMIQLLKQYEVLSALPAQQLNMDPANQTLVFERKNLIFICNFHPTQSIPDYKFYVSRSGTYRIILNSDEARFGGHARVDSTVEHHSQPDDHGTPQLSIYNVNRTILVLERVDNPTSKPQNKK